jgi:hypothetical protein
MAALGEQILHLPGDRRIKAGQRLVEHDEARIVMSAPASATCCFMPRENASQRTWA